MAFRTLFLALAAALVFAPASAIAQTQGQPSAAQKETARALMQTGDAKFAANDFRAALEAYSGADDIVGVPTTALAVGRTYARLGLLVEAVDALQRVARYPAHVNESNAFVRARREAARLDADLARRIPTLTVRVTGPAPDTPLRVEIDGSALEGNVALRPRRINPGEHVVTVSAVGYVPNSERVRVAEGDNAQLQVDLKPTLNGGTPEVDDEVDASNGGAPAVTQKPVDVHAAHHDDPGWLLPLMWGGFSLAGTGVVVGSITGAVVLARRSELEARCGGTVCLATEKGYHSTTNTIANVSNVAFAIGAAGAVVGAGALIADQMADDESDASTARVKPLIGPGFVGIRGAF